MQCNTKKKELAYISAMHFFIRHIASRDQSLGNGVRSETDMPGVINGLWHAIEHTVYIYAALKWINYTRLFANNRI